VIAAKHSQLFPWYVGIAIIVAFEAIFGYLFFAGPSPCGPQVGPIFISLLIILPVIYLALMFLTLRSQP
jgi:hypothetical protein